MCKYEDCTGLESVKLPTSLTEILPCMFYGCESMKSIEIPESVKDIQNWAFYNCYGLESVSMGASVLTAGSDVFYNCNNLKAVYTPSLESWCNISFADRYSNPVCFCGTLYVNNKELETIEELPSSLTGVKDYTFYCIKSLKSVVIPEGYTSIGNYSFSGCRNLESVKIANTVTSIGDEAFDFTGLKSIEISANVTSLGNYVVCACPNLESITVSAENPVYDSRDNCNAIIETATNTLISGCNTSFIPNTVTALGESAFYQFDGLTSIEIPNSVESIPDKTFCFCSNLKSVVIGSSVKSIAQSAFLCTDVESIKVDSENTVYDSRDNCNAIIVSETNELFLGSSKTVIPSSVNAIIFPGFSYNSGLTSIVIPGTIKKIGDLVFRDSSLEEIQLENGVTTLGDGALFACTSLTSVCLPASVTYIGRMAFGFGRALQYLRCDAVTPPTLGDYVFNMVNTYNCELQVPDESVEAYKAASQWCDFVNITEVEKICNDDNVIVVENGRIVNNSNANIEVYNISGVKVYSGKEQSVTLPSGIYIIKADNKTMKATI
ncbi:MAG: leucine-rich repeat domain-containing protein [Muribaculaceae bacterium]